MRYVRILLLGLLALAMGLLLSETQLASAQPGVIDRVLIDADPSTPGAVTSGTDPVVGTLGTVEICRSGISIGQSVSVDIILDEVDPADGSLDIGGGVNVGVRFDDSRLDFVSVEGLGPLEGVSPIPASLVEPVDDTFSRLAASIAKFPGSYPEFSGVHLWTRVNFTAQAEGVASVSLEDVPGSDGTRDFYVGLSGPGMGQPVKVFDLNDDNGDGFTLSSYGDPVQLGIEAFMAGCDGDGDGIEDALDNCPTTPNPLQENADFDLNAGGASVGGVALPSDADGDACDDEDDNDSGSETQDPGASATTCPTGSLPVWADCVETYLGTDLLDNCSADTTADNEPLDALPTDMNDDRSVNILDVFKMFPFWLSPTPTGREDLNADGVVNILDVFKMFPRWLDTCT